MEKVSAMSKKSVVSVHIVGQHGSREMGADRYGNLESKVILVLEYNGIGVNPV
jgi:hypothetical protein